MRALVTGVAGFIGSHLADHLLSTGASVTGIDCFTDYYPRALKQRNLDVVLGRPNFSFVESSLGQTDLARLLDGVTHVFHLAAQAGVRKSWGAEFQIYTQNNVDATQALLEAALAAKLERFVYASSSSVYGGHTPLPMREDVRTEPLSPYGVTKLAAEQLCHLYHENHRLPTVSLRYFTVYGPRQRPDMAFHRFGRAVITGQPITIYGDGEQTRDFTFVADAVQATVAAGLKGVPGRVYNVGGGSRVTVNEVLELLRRITQRPVRIERLPDQKGDMRHTYADTSLAERDLAFAPTITLERGLEAEYRWLEATRPWELTA